MPRTYDSLLLRGACMNMFHVEPFSRSQHPKSAELKHPELEGTCVFVLQLRICHVRRCFCSHIDAFSRSPSEMHPSLHSPQVLVAMALTDRDAVLALFCLTDGANWKQKRDTNSELSL